MAIGVLQCRLFALSNEAFLNTILILKYIILLWEIVSIHKCVCVCVCVCVQELYPVREPVLYTHCLSENKTSFWVLYVS